MENISGQSGARRSIKSRDVIFVVGLAVYALAFYLLNAWEAEKTVQFLWGAILVAYVLFFLPFIFGSLRIKTLVEDSPAVTILWTTDTIFCVLLILSGALVALGILPMKIAAIVDCVFLFFALLAVVTARATSAHTRAVTFHETVLLKTTDDIKKSANSLLSKAQSCKELTDNPKALEKLEGLVEDISYLSPTSDEGARAVEQNLLQALAAFSSFLNGAFNEADFEKNCDKVANITRERKLFRE